MSKIVELTVSNFKENVLESGGVVLVDFWAPWCGPCKAIAPLLDELADEMAGKAVIGKVNIDDNGELAQTYRIRGIPTLLVFKQGQLVGNEVGALSKSEIQKVIEQHI